MSGGPSGGVEYDRFDKGIALVESLPTVESVERSELSILSESYDCLRIETSHYMIYTTVLDRLMLGRLPMLLESAWSEFDEFVPAIGAGSLDKGEIYYFDSREQWLAYTRANTGASADIFAKIDSGAYCYDGKCVAWRISRRGDLSILAHECWHQYCGQHMRVVLPSWLAESSAVYLESYKWDAGGLKFSAKYNIGRLVSLRQSMDAGLNFSVRQLVGSDPGYYLSRTEGMSGEQVALYVSGYYSRLYALSRFMFEYEYGIYRSGYEQIFADAMSGDLKLSDELLAAAGDYVNTRQWSNEAGMELFLNYIGVPEGEFERRYQGYCAKLGGAGCDEVALFLDRITGFSTD